MEDLGKRLQEERLKRKIDLQEISDATHIQISVLKDIESGNFDKYKGDEEYIKMYLRKYSEYLGIDSREFVDNYVSITQEIKLEELSQKEEQEKAAQQRSSITLSNPKYARTKKVYENSNSTNYIRYFIIAVLIVLIIAAIYYGIRLVSNTNSNFNSSNNFQVSGEVEEDDTLVSEDDTLEDEDALVDEDEEDTDTEASDTEETDDIRIEHTDAYTYTVYVSGDLDTFTMRIEFVGRTWSSLRVNGSSYSGFIDTIYNEANTSNDLDAEADVVELEFNTNDVYEIVLRNGFNYGHRYYFNDVEVEVPDSENVGDTQNITFNIVKE